MQVKSLSTRNIKHLYCRVSNERKRTKSKFSSLSCDTSAIDAISFCWSLGSSNRMLWVSSEPGQRRRRYRFEWRLLYNRKIPNLSNYNASTVDKCIKNVPIFRQKCANISKEVCRYSDQSVSIFRQECTVTLTVVYRYSNKNVPIFGQNCADIPIFGHVGITIHFRRSYGTLLSEYRYIGIRVRRNNGIPPFVCICVSLSLFLSVSGCVSVCMCFCLFICFPVFFSESATAWMSFYSLCLCVSLLMSVWLCLFAMVSLFVCLSECLCMSVCVCLLWAYPFDISL